MVIAAYGKFAQVDPAYDQTKDDPESWNLYSYCTNNPVTHTDPDGRTFIDASMNALSNQAIAAVSGEWGGTGMLGSSLDYLDHPAPTPEEKKQPAPDSKKDEARTGNLTQATLEKAHFTADQAAAVSKAGATAMDLAGAIAVIEAAKNPGTINGTAGAMSNAFDRSDVLKSGITQAGLTKDDNKLLSMVTTSAAYQVLTRPDMMKQITGLLTSHSSLVDTWKSDYTAIRGGGANPVGDHRAFWVNVGRDHNGNNHIPTYKDSKGAINSVTSGMRGGCLVIGGLCFRDSYHATKVEVP